MEDIYLGRVITTHGIKGELRIKSTFPYKEKAFKIGNTNKVLKNLVVIPGYLVVLFT